MYEKYVIDVKMIYVYIFVFREGTNQYEKAFGVSSKDLFKALYR